MPRTKEMVEAMLLKYTKARNSDEYLFACILDHYFEWDIVNFFIEIPAVQFINTMVRARRLFQMKGMYEANSNVKERRQAYSMYRSNENKATKKDIQKISLLKNKRKWK